VPPHEFAAEIPQQAQQQRGVLLLLGYEKLCSAKVFGVAGLGCLAQQLLSVAALAELEAPNGLDQRAVHCVGDPTLGVEVDGRVDPRVHGRVLLEMVDPAAELADLTGLLRHGRQASGSWPSC
jgi:hypothetical protein